MAVARCSLPSEPPAAGPEKFDATAVAMIALFKYGTGMPFNRMERLEGQLGIPLPATTQWELMEQAAEWVRPVLDELIRQAAQGSVVHNDDTSMRILQLARDNDDGRTGTFTSGIVSIWRVEDRAVLYRMEACGRKPRRCSETARGGLGAAHSDVRRVVHGTRRS